MRKIALLGFIFVTVSGFSQNLQNYTPSILFEKGKWEFKSFQNLYTQTKAFSGGSKAETGRGRETYFTSINQFLYGVNNQINVGLDFWVKNVNLENGQFTNRTAITGFGPKVKIAPFNNLKRLSIQSTLLFPLADDLEGRGQDAENPGLFLEFDRTLWLNQIFYDHQFNDYFQIFFQQAFWYNFVRDSFRENDFLQSQTSVFFSVFPNPKWTFYVMTEYFPTHYNDSNQEFELAFSYFAQSGIGWKYQLIPSLLEVEFLYTNFWAGSEGTGAGQTINLGIRLVNQ
ncbi:MAG: hypothetical protein KI790_03370 [Cyclobacteriaceae bacterium]|nr:hypothetical protein [Cyclobacteriaceae bacterium HetDA_MAG_MS6]